MDLFPVFREHFSLFLQREMRPEDSRLRIG